MKKPGERRASSFGLQGMKTAGGTGSPPTRRACWRTSAQGKGPPSGSWPKGAVRRANRNPVPGALRAIEQAACQPSTGGPARQLRGTGPRHKRIFAEGPSTGRGFPPSLPFRQLIPSQFGNAMDTAGM